MKKIFIVLGLLILFLIVGIFWWQSGMLPADSKNKTSKIFVVNKGEGIRIIANNLKKENLIRDPVVFFLLVRYGGLDKQIQAGDFRLNPSMSANDVANTLTHGILDIWVTFPEGLRAEEFASLLKEKIPSYQDSWRAQLVENEGYLFPDTYLIPKDATIELVLSLFKNNFDKKYESVSKNQTNGLTKEQTIIVASMVEREAKKQEDRPIVASVILNRLGLGMKLDIDATVQYALGYQENTKRWWKKDLTLDDLGISSPYNTYKNAGLPPTAISNPGILAIEATLNPSNTDYLYYITDAKGVNHYAKTLDEQNANIQKYGTP